VEKSFIGYMKAQTPEKPSEKVLHRLYEGPNSRKTRWKSPS
jgi:hypothetical protein